MFETLIYLKALLSGFIPYPLFLSIESFYSARAVVLLLSVIGCQLSRYLFGFLTYIVGPLEWVVFLVGFSFAISISKEAPILAFRLPRFKRQYHFRLKAKKCGSFQVCLVAQKPTYYDDSPHESK